MAAGPAGLAPLLHHRARLRALPLVALALAACRAESEPLTVVEPTYEATIRRTTHGVAHITAEDLPSVIFGQAYAFAEDHACILADQILKVRSERAAFLGPGPGDRHIASDIGYLALEVYADAEALLASQSAETQALIEAYAAGYNAYLEDTGIAGIPGYCRGAPWVRPISATDLAAYYVSLGLVASGVQLVDFMASAQPPGSDRELPGPPASRLRAAAASGLGSNGWAIGSERSASGRGMVVGNPHFPHYGELKLWESHLRVPGAIDVYGATLLGVPGALIGFNEHVAWTHTFSVEGSRFTLYTVDLVPGSPTQYRYDDTVRDMIPREFVVAVRGDDGELADHRRTLWFTHYGPILNVNNFGWNQDKAITYRDANRGKFNLIDQWLRWGMARSLGEFVAIADALDGIPWVHTMAADREGEVFYLDGATTPNLSQAAIDGWQAALADGEFYASALYAQAGVVVLDGSSSINEWVIHPSTGKPTVPITEVPRLAGRRDFVMNANDSHWLTNPAAPLVGYSPLHGAEEVAPSPRTRNNLLMLTEVREDGASGADGRFTLEELEAAILSNRSMTSELLLDAVVARCQGSPTITVDEQEIDLGPACAALAAWDGRYDLESVGAIVWRELIGAFNPTHLRSSGPLFAVGFDPEDPIATPHTLRAAPDDDEDDEDDEDDDAVDPLHPRLASVLRNLEAAGIDPAAPLGAVQFAERAGERVPIHGGHGGDGVANQVSYGSLTTALEPSPSRGEVIQETTGLAVGGYLITYGTSFLLAMEFTDDGPRGAALLTYGQSDDPASPHHIDQMRAFSAKEWRPIAFTEAAITSDPELHEKSVAR